MLSALFNFVKSIGEFLANVVNFVLKLLSDLVNVVKLLAESVLKIPDWLGFMPSIMIASILGILSIVVVYKFLGRD